jgi:hypothetical protein
MLPPAPVRFRPPPADRGRTRPIREPARARTSITPLGLWQGRRSGPVSSATASLLGCRPSHEEQCRDRSCTRDDGASRRSVSAAWSWFDDHLVSCARKRTLSAEDNCYGACCGFWNTPADLNSVLTIGCGSMDGFAPCDIGQPHAAEPLCGNISRSAPLQIAKLIRRP